MIQSGCAFGGTPGGWPNLTPGPRPARGCRVIPGRVWWTLIFLPWREYRASRAAGIPAPAPFLAAPGVPGLYFTDRQSLQGLLSPAEYAWRVSLPLPAHDECQRYGCAVIEFDVPAHRTVIIPSPYPRISAGLTPGGAREWFLQGTLELDETMVISYIDIVGGKPGYFLLPL
jgi:hypothetical protein